MKKKIENDHFPLRKWKKVLLVMKLKLFIMMLCIHSLNATTYSQDQKLDVRFENELIISVLDYLKIQTGYQFFFQKGVISETEKITVNMKNVTLGEVLDNVLKAHGYSYEVLEGVIIVKRDEEQKQERQTIVGIVTDQKKFPMPGVTVKILNGVHALNMVAGFEARSNEYGGINQTSYGYQPDRGKSFVKLPVVTPAGAENRYVQVIPKVTSRTSNYVSYYFTGSYMYDNRYSINFSVRGDASNRFGETAKFLPVWSLGLRWNVSDEHWMANQNLVNNLTVTASLGYQGNVAENVSPDLIAKIQAVDATTGEYRMTWSQLPNPDLKWEKTLSINLGVNFSLFQSKLNGAFNWYHKKTTDIISSKEVPYENGTTSMYINDGDVMNKGWDLSLNVVPIRTKNFMWSLGTSFSGNDNKVDSEIEPNGEWRNAVSGGLNKKGYPVGSFWAFRFTGLDPNNGGPLFDWSEANTDDGTQDATAYMMYMGTREPTFTLGINMVFRWKRFSFPLNFYISRGNYEFLSSPYENGYMMMSEYQNASSQLNDRWRKPGDEKRTNIPSIPVGENCRPLHPFASDTEIYPLEAWEYSNVRVVNAWYIRFSDFRFSYHLPEKWIKNFAKDVTFSFTASNPLQIKSKDFKGRDPEVALGQQPRSQDFSFGVTMSF